MLNMTQKLVVLALTGAALATSSNGSHASNVYKGGPTAAEQAAIATFQPPYWVCPGEFRVCPMPTITAKADDATSRTDATAVDVPEPSGWSPENARRYYDYSRFILGD